MEIDLTRAKVREMYSGFPNGNDIELITKGELESKTLLAVSGNWGTNECIPVSSVYPSRAYFCNGEVDKYPISSKTIIPNGQDKLWLSKRFQSLTFTSIQPAGQTTPLALNINVDPNRDPATILIANPSTYLTYIALLYQSNYMILSALSQKGIWSLGYTMDGVNSIIILNIT